MNAKSILLLEAEGREVLKRICRRAKIPVPYIEQLIAAELEQVGRLRKRGLKERFDQILGELADGLDDSKG